MKKALTAVILMAYLALSAASACAQLGFAEVKKQNVNLRTSPTGKAVTQLDAPRSVYIFEEKTVGGQLWCHVYTYIGKYPRDGWIRGDMLRFLSEEFHNVVDVEAGSKYVLGIRADGSVAIMGDDMPHMPCIDEVRSWSNVEQVVSHSVAVNALNKDGRILAAGKFNHSAGLRAAKITGGVGFPIDERSAFMRSAWAGFFQSERIGWLDGVAVREVVGRETFPYFALTEDGDIIGWEDGHPLNFGTRGNTFCNSPYTDIDMFWNHAAALRADGRVDAVGDGMYPRVLETGSWENVIKVAAGEDFTLGLRRDGAVYFAGEDETHAAQVAAWENVVDIAAGPRFSVALMRDGSVAMAGIFSEEYFR